MAPLHSLELCFYPRPTTLNILSVHSHGRINKVDGVIDNSMTCHIWKGLNPAIGCPIIWVNVCPWGCVGIYYWQQCSSISPRNNFHIPQCWWLWCVHHAKNPYFLSCCSASVILSVWEKIWCSYSYIFIMKYLTLGCVEKETHLFELLLRSTQDNWRVTDESLGTNLSQPLVYVNSSVLSNFCLFVSISHQQV